MKTRYKFQLLLVLLLSLSLSSCMKDLDVEPIDDDLNVSSEIYKNPESYRQVLAKCYAGLAVTGQEGPAGNADISGIDEGFSSYLRQYWSAQELTTDEAIIAWNDGNLRDYHDQDWAATNEFITAMYNRVFYQISLVNEFLRETTDSKLDERGVSGELRAEVEEYRAEARFLRAFSYWHALDMFRNVPFVTEKDKVGAFFPEQATAKELFDYLEAELLDLENALVDPGQNEFGRVDKAAAWMLLSKLYLNAEVYIGEQKYTECITYTDKVANSSYELHANYDELFLADNHLVDGMIFSVAFDGLYTKTWGGTTFIVHGGVGGSMDPAEFGIDGGWGGMRTTSAFVQKFGDVFTTTDQRAMFHTDGQSLEIDDIFEFTEGYALKKFKNVTSTGAAGADLTHPDTDWPVFRVADAYLMYAEAALRGGTGGSLTQALTYVNLVRRRAYGDNSGDITQGQLTLDFILDERARELYWEGHRRTDLVRFGRFSNSSYVWPWKGGVKEGIAVDEKYDIFPIPSSDVTANPNLDQNPDY